MIRLRWLEPIIALAALAAMVIVAGQVHRDLKKTRRILADTTGMATLAEHAAEQAAHSAEQAAQWAVAAAAQRPLSSRIEIAPRDNYDQLDRLSGSFNDVAERKEIPCGELIGAQTAVLLILGQSNASNEGEGSYQPSGSVYNFNLFDGKCCQAEEPLLGRPAAAARFRRGSPTSFWPTSWRSASYSHRSPSVAPASRTGYPKDGLTDGSW